MIKHLHLYLTLLLLAVCGSSWAQSFTITFGKIANPTAINSSTGASTVVTSGTEYLLAQPFSNVKLAYYGHLDTAIRLGKSGNGGTLSLALADAYHVYATSIIVKAQLCDATKSANLSVNELTGKKVGSSESDITFTLDGHGITSIDLKSTDYIYISSITVNYVDSDPSILTGIQLSEGSDINKQYIEGDAFDCSGIVATGTHADLTTETVKGIIDWTVTPATLSLGQTSVQVTATARGITSDPIIVNGLTVYRKGTSDNPLTTTEAKKLIQLFGTANDVYVKGYISKVGQINNGRIIYYIQDESGTLLRVSSGMNIGDAKFTSADELKVGAKVLLSGNLNLVNTSVYQLAPGNHLLAYTNPATYILDEDATNFAITEGVTNVTLKRSFNKNAWNTLILPFSVSAEQLKEVFGSKVKVADFIGDTQQADGTYILNFASSTTGFQANIPVLIWGINEDQTSFIFNNVNLKKTLLSTQVIKSGNDFSFVATFIKKSASDLAVDGRAWFIASDNKYYRFTGTETLKATRGFFVNTSSSVLAKGLMMSIDGFNEETTGISLINNEELGSSNSNATYNLAGQKVGNSYKGIVIKNGKKVIN